MEERETLRDFSEAGRTKADDCDLDIELDADVFHIDEDDSREGRSRGQNTLSPT